MKLRVLVMEKSIYPEGKNPVYGEEVTRIRVDDEAGGGFLVIQQSTDHGVSEVRVTIEELCLLYQHGREMMQGYDAAVPDDND